MVFIFIKTSSSRSGVTLFSFLQDNSDAYTSLQANSSTAAVGGNNARPPFAPFNTATSNAGYNAPVRYNTGAIGPKFPPPANANNVGNVNPRPNPPLPRPPFQTQHTRVPQGGERFQPPAPAAVGPTAGQSFGQNALPSHFGKMANSEAQPAGSFGSTTTPSKMFDGYSFDNFVVEADNDNQRNQRLATLTCTLQSAHCLSIFWL